MGSNFGLAFSLGGAVPLGIGYLSHVAIDRRQVGHIVERLVG